VGQAGLRPEVATIETADLAAEGVYERWKPARTCSCRWNVDPASLPGWEFSDRMIKKIKRAVPASRTIECPYGPA
jgi:hypothetical protein